MEMYIKSNHYKLWMIITNGDIPIPKPKVECTNEDLTIMELNTKSCYTLSRAVSKNEYNKICRLKTTKVIWNSLIINYKGT